MIFIIYFYFKQWTRPVEEVIGLPEKTLLVRLRSGLEMYNDVIVCVCVGSVGSPLTCIPETLYAGRVRPRRGPCCTLLFLCLSVPAESQNNTCFGFSKLGYPFSHDTYTRRCSNTHTHRNRPKLDDDNDLVMMSHTHTRVSLPLVRRPTFSYRLKQKKTPLK